MVVASAAVPEITFVAIADSVVENKSFVIDIILVDKGSTVKDANGTVPIVISPIIGAPPALDTAIDDIFLTWLASG